MKTRTWILLFAILLLLCGGLSLYFLQPGEAARYAQITLDGSPYKTVDLHQDQEFVVTQGNGASNTITVKDGRIAVTAASCPDHYCMQRGYCNSGTQIVCLPNRLVIQFLGEQTVDAAVG